MPCVSYGQYDLYVNESEYLELPEPPMDGYMEKAWWYCDNENIYFSSTSQVGAVIYPKHYFEGTAVVECEYYYSYLAYDGSMRANYGTETFYITCKAVITTLHDSYVEISPGDQYKLSYTRGTSSFGYPTMTWKSSDTSVAQVNSSGTVTAISNGSARITCDPVSGPLVFCDVKVCENTAGGNNGSDDDDDSGNSGGSSDDNIYEQSLRRINDLKYRAKDYFFFP